MNFVLVPEKEKSGEARAPDKVHVVPPPLGIQELLSGLKRMDGAKIQKINFAEKLSEIQRLN